MDNYKIIVGRFYKAGIYSVENVAVFVQSGRLTPDEYKEITGQDYVI